MSKKDTLRFKICVSSASPELYGHLKEFGPYYRSRRLLQLAQIGFSIQNGIAIQAPHQALPVKQLSPDETRSSVQQSYFPISEDVASQLEGMFDSLDNLGAA